MEYARNVLGISDAAHAEYDPNAPTPVIALASCPVAQPAEGTPRLSGKLKIRVSPGSLAFRIYRRQEAQEPFSCSYELNPAFKARIEAGGLRIVGVGQNGEARIVELPGHRFFVATLFQPQLASTEGRPHPLITAYLEAMLSSKEAG